jgi:hypothetical protein
MRIAVAIAFCLAFAGCQNLQNELGHTTVRGATPEDDDFDHLRAAALLVDRGEIAPAIPHLKAHLKQHPDAPMIRAYLAELLMKAGHEGEAKTEYEQFVRDASGQDGLAKHHLVHAHTKLMEIAAEADDSFHEYYHRGAALMHLASPDAEGGERWNEQTLTKALAATRKAIELDAGNPRPLLTLMEIQLRLDQPAAARQTREKLKGTLSDPTWTAAERERIRGGNS